MSLQWLAVSSFLYLELIITLLLILPILKPSLWKKIFNFRIFSSFQRIWSTFFYTLLTILVVLFLDSTHKMVKYSGQGEGTKIASLDSKLDRLLNECKGQRNFYITGFSLFLMLVIRRLITTISQYATLDAMYEAALKQARSANEELKRRMKNKETDERKDTHSKEDYEAMQNELKKSQADLEAMKKQAEATNSEYDRLSSEFQKLQNEAQTSKEQKKDV